MLSLNIHWHIRLIMGRQPPPQYRDHVKVMTETRHTVCQASPVGDSYRLYHYIESSD